MSEEFTKFKIEFKPWFVTGTLTAEVVAETSDAAKEKFLSMVAGCCIPSYPNLQRVKILSEKIYEEDAHVACYSYPNCDEAPRGCVVKNGRNAEQYGHRD